MDQYNDRTQLWFDDMNQYNDKEHSSGLMTWINLLKKTQQWFKDMDQCNDKRYSSGLNICVNVMTKDFVMTNGSEMTGAL